MPLFNPHSKIDTKNIPLGEHLVVSRGLYTHHGIYVGNKKVIHYAGLAEGFKKDRVRITDLTNFAGGKEIRAYKYDYLLKNHKFSSSKIVERAHLRLGESQYNLFWNNCESFANWCTHNDDISFQTESSEMYWRDPKNVARTGGPFINPVGVTKRIVNLFLPK